MRADEVLSVNRVETFADCVAVGAALDVGLRTDVSPYEDLEDSRLDRDELDELDEVELNEGRAEYDEAPYDDFEDPKLDREELELDEGPAHALCVVAAINAEATRATS